MWLLNATSKHLRAFLPDKVPATGYAILSHTWDPDPDDEILFADFEASGGDRAILPAARLKRSWRKVESACGQALDDGYTWVWIDTCCIDKSSSSELSEAINSMYSCLERDQSKKITDSSEPRPWAVSNPHAKVNWFSIGDRTDLSDLVASVTGIGIDILMDPEVLESASIAQRMSWASSRVTSRPEDMAYCLMGIFKVNMPMLYGEGAQNAFLRLQEEIMKSSDDQSLFAWRDERADPISQHGLLATSPRFFRGSNRVVPYQDWKPRCPYAMTNRGLQIELPLTRVPSTNNRYRAVLDCPALPDYEDHCFLTITLEKLAGSETHFARVLANQFGSESNPGAIRRIYVRQYQQWNHKVGVFPRHVFQLRNAHFTKGTYRLVDLWMPRGAEVVDVLETTANTKEWLLSPKPQAFKSGKAPWAQVAGALLFDRAEDGERLLVRIGSTDSTKVGFDAVRQLPKYRAGLEDEDYLGRQVGDNFAPRPSGTSVELKYHRVDVDFAEPQIHGDSRYIMVDFQIIATGFSEQLTSMNRDVEDLLRNNQSAAHTHEKKPYWKRLLLKDH